jgi:hypothetical protein
MLDPVALTLIRTRRRIKRTHRMRDIRLLEPTVPKEISTTIGILEGTKG